MNSRKNTGEQVFDILLYAGMALVMLLTLYPFWEQLAVSLSGISYTTKVMLWPKDITLASYNLAFGYSAIWTGYGNTIIRTVLGVILSLVVSTMIAYGLSKTDLPYNKVISSLILFTMLFNGGLIPNYLLIKNLGLMNSLWALVLPNLVFTFHIFILRNFFRSLPEELEESARIDGADYFYIFWRIVLPLSVPVLATVSLWIGVYHWNEWFNALLFINDPDKQVLQVLLRKIIIENNMQDMSNMMMQMGTDKTFTSRQLQATVIMFSILPMLVVYPFIQKYFVKGVMVGAIKG